MLGILDDVKVIEVGDYLGGAFCAKLLADQGADTLKIETPINGDPSRHEPPFIGGAKHIEKSSVFLAYNTNKKSMTLNLGIASGVQLFLRLVEDIDVVVDGYPVGYLESLGLGYEILKARNSRLILTSVSPFGSTGPYKDYLSSDLIEQAMGGHLITGGDIDKEPMALPQDQAAVTCGRNGAIAIAAALLYQRATGEGQQIDVSSMEAMVQTPPGHIHQYSFTGNNAGRGGGGGQTSVMDSMHLETADGYVTLTTAGTGGVDAMDSWGEFLELPEIQDPKFKTAGGRLQHLTELRELVVSKLKQWKSHDFFKAAMDKKFVVGVVQSPSDVVNCVHLGERDSYAVLTHPEIGNMKYPGVGFITEHGNPTEGGKAAPLLGENTEAILSGKLGVPAAEIAALRADGVI